MEPAIKGRLSLAEYRQLEEENDNRYEYHSGEVFSMAGGSPKHSAIATNVIGLFSNLLPKNCRAFGSDLKVYIRPIDKGLYPDVSVACRPIALMNELNAITNPILLVEVLSKSTADYDRGAKFRHFSKIDSLREYVLVEQDTWTVETRYRSSADESWEMNWFEGKETEVILRSLGIKLPVSDIYSEVDDL